MHVNKTSYHRSVHEYEEKLEGVLVRAKSLRARVSDIILLCEAVKELQ